MKRFFLLLFFSAITTAGAILAVGFFVVTLVSLLPALLFVVVTDQAFTFAQFWAELAACAYKRASESGYENIENSEGNNEDE